MTIKIGTSHFVSETHAVEYYRPYGIGVKGVYKKIADKEIKIGPPKINPGERLITVDNGTRYAIEKDGL